ncbi:hypothetical protein CBR_g46629 [Chara braunii]|uniref:HAT C-terminal dimerisation domain-containing protein n=1 Tax=Chara braunii TaxID=69332 RepID=A0A388M0S8_CHABU|nr:hypothetical protein CBR_g46629 [Chara braunii]|eukprot:GBG88141.1 hypothetical protein CBR_g46629 [Chara braunii]
MRCWNAMTSPLHDAALFMDPAYRASQPETDAEVADGFWTWVSSWCKEPSYVEVDAEVCSWIEGTGRHTCEVARTQARLMQPVRWWRKWCSDMPILQKQAVHLLGQVSASSCCERNWSLFERIHSRLCNNLGAIKLSTLVFIRWNQRLLDALIKKPKTDKASTKWEMDEPVEDLTRDEMAADARLWLAERRGRLHRIEPVGDAGENDDSGSDDYDDIPVQAPQTPAPEEVTIQRHRLRNNLLELERELNSLNESWRNATKASKFLARQRLHELDQATRSMTVEGVEGGNLAGGPAPAHGTRKRGRLQKESVQEEEAATQGGTGDEEVGDVEGGNLAGGPAPAHVRRKRGRPQKEPVQEVEEAARKVTSTDESGGCGDENDGSSNESDGSGDGRHRSGDGRHRSGDRDGTDGSSEEDESEGDEKDGHEGSGGSDGTDGSGKEDESEGDEKDGSSSEQGDSESEPLYDFCT